MIEQRLSKNKFQDYYKKIISEKYRTENDDKICNHPIHLIELLWLKVKKCKAENIRFSKKKKSYYKKIHNEYISYNIIIFDILMRM